LLSLRPLPHLLSSPLFLSTTRLPPTSTLFPYTTLFRSSGPPSSCTSPRGPPAGRPYCSSRSHDAIRSFPASPHPAPSTADWHRVDRKSTRLTPVTRSSRMPSSA